MSDVSIICPDWSRARSAYWRACLWHHCGEWRSSVAGGHTRQGTRSSTTLTLQTTCSSFTRVCAGIRSLVEGTGGEHPGSFGGRHIR